MVGMTGPEVVGVSAACCRLWRRGGSAVMLAAAARLAATALLAVAALLAGCGGGPDADRSSEGQPPEAQTSTGGTAAGSSEVVLEVFVGIPPLEGLAGTIGGDRVEVRSLVPGGQSPHTYEPTPSQMAALATADLYLSIEMPFEKVLISKVKGSATGLQFLDISRDIDRRQMIAHAHDESSHDPHDHAGHDHAGHDHAGHGHDCGGAGDDTHADPHVWMAPANLRQLAEEVAQAYEEADPEGAAAYRSNLEQYQERIQSLEAELARILSPFAGDTLYVYHPAFGYFTDAFGLVQTAVEIEGKEPTPRQLTELIARARREGVRLLIVQPQFDPRSAQTVAEAIGGTVLPVDPLGEDIATELRRLAEAIRAGSPADSLKKLEGDS